MHPGQRSWADKVVEAETTPPPLVEDDLMDTWLEATKHTGADGNVVLPLMVIKLVMALLQKVTIALKESCQAHQCIDCLEARLVELVTKPHPLPAKPTTWANAMKQVTGDPMSRLQQGQLDTQIVQNINMALRTIDAKLGDQEVKAVGVVVLKPSGDIKIYTMTHAMAWWLLENKHWWTTIVDPRLVTQAS
ncbi:hypothetical protein CROQUDRAFT_97303 [Cronartium quercuum f. sp. fusiforme G11]|uniref:Uncharacterized protein n=1 Tax=Cronartium quercuum f. sp. fusiforme G11 TaxID=708437 RepID=A0A9P6T9L4_9BASI|nr:hypothetical protein CROQUDRAFT_97303 [Cronartium quercuum f. sp. fusiforme G11]